MLVRNCYALRCFADEGLQSRDYSLKYEALYPAGSTHADLIESILMRTIIIIKYNKLNLVSRYLKTHIYQPAAVQLYQRLGFEFTSEFGGYQYELLSLYRLKSLGASNR